jgi:hypothetical protein
MLSHSAGDGDKKARSPGRARRKPLKPLARGMPGEPGVTVVTTLVCFLFFAREAAGATSARHSLRPPISGRKVHARLGRGCVARGWNCASCSVVPALSGTHNHRFALWRESRRPAFFQYRRRGVWVPAFAGTTPRLGRREGRFAPGCLKFEFEWHRAPDAITVM